MHGIANHETRLGNVVALESSPVKTADGDTGAVFPFIVGFCPHSPPSAKLKWNNSCYYY